VLFSGVAFAIRFLTNLFGLFPPVLRFRAFRLGRTRIFRHADTLSHSSLVASPLGLTDALLIDERSDLPDLVLERVVECIRAQP
jgi:hypothetical protein